MSHFDKKAQGWDKGDVRVNGALVIAQAIEKKITLTKNMQVIDFGVGTGLLGFEIAKRIQKVYGVDTSSKMLEKLEEKNSDTINIKAIHQDIIKEPLQDTFDGLVSSMTLHHIQDLKAFFNTIYNNLKDSSFLAIADLEEEDGTFHSDNSGVYHFGFNKEELCQIVKECGFKNVNFENINTINKPQRNFGVFLLTATKN